MLLKEIPMCTYSRAQKFTNVLPSWISEGIYGRNQHIKYCKISKTSCLCKKKSENVLTIMQSLRLDFDLYIHNIIFIFLSSNILQYGLRVTGCLP